MGFRCFLLAKIHNATITEANVNYRGSIAICPELLKASGIMVNEQVDVYNTTNGNRLTTYVIEGKKGEICLNGAAALKGAVGDKIIIAAYTWLSPLEAEKHHPTIVIIGDKENRIEEVIKK